MITIPGYSFKRSEFLCKCLKCGFDVVDHELLEVLQACRDDWGERTDKPVQVVIISGCRCREHNKAVGGVPKSQHLLGKAADIKVCQSGEIIPSKEIYAYLYLKYPDKYGLKINSQEALHVDVRSKRWRG